MLKRIHRLWFYTALIISLLIGIFLRLYLIDVQILGDDEFHTLRQSYFSSYKNIFSNLGESDYSIPLALFYKFLLNTIGLSELTIRAPMIIAGIAALLILPTLVSPYVSKSTTIIFLIYLSTSPFHIYFTRYARPYGIIMLLSFIALICFLEWFKNGKKFHLIGYITATSLAGYLNLICIPYLLSPSVFFFLLRISNDKLSSKILTPTEIFLPAFITVIIFLLLYIAPISSSLDAILDKTDKSIINWNTLIGFGKLFVGTSNIEIAITSLAICIYGAISPNKNHKLLFYYLILCALVHLIFVLLMRPSQLIHPIVFGRYSFVLLPTFLLLYAEGTKRIYEFFIKKSGFILTSLFGIAWITALFLTNPIHDIYTRPNNWTNHAMFQYQYDSSHTLNKTLPNTSLFYKNISYLPKDSILLAVAPTYYVWDCNIFPIYQRISKQKMINLFVSTPNSSESLRQSELPTRMKGSGLKNSFHIADLKILQSNNVDYLVIHKNISNEIPKSEFTCGIIDMNDWINYYKCIFGRVYFEDNILIVFDLKSRRNITDTCSNSYNYLLH